jgi:hypothetical protein
VDDTFVFTEIVRVGQIGKIALRSFFLYHPKTKVHVFGLDSDRESIEEFPNVIYHSLDNPDPSNETWGKNPLKAQLLKRRYQQIAKNFDHGHLGTAGLWAILTQTRPEKYLIHFDSDVVFRDVALPDILNQFKKGKDLVGRIRNYKHNQNNFHWDKDYPDPVQTCFFGFNRTLVNRHSFKTLTKMCQGVFNPLGFAVIDFFDPVSFEMVTNGAKIGYLDSNAYGGEDDKGSRKNNYPKVNALIDFGDKLAHFSAVGSGMNFYKNKAHITGVPDSYMNYGLEKYAVYVKLFYNEDIDYKYDKKPYAPLFSIKKWY